eukprot:CAMPEP_0113476644 /NCGR_PEP_ID=MMETSP0014_2-20120614/19779_1 /TAXON_ID=2857 /ORGANISM="Nitzschia sp." /LENGTH=494 /DNA_ID=CAMNT_0000369675 /DNA_START=7 /DNA_END=1488 /DNA_ORIENTATION=+ /assembly_acc=CAM_ASM_000159
MAESVVVVNNRRRQLFSSSSSTNIISRTIKARTAALPAPAASTAASALSISTTSTTTTNYHHQYSDGRTSSQLVFTGLLGLTAAAAAAATASTQYDADVSSSSSYLPTSSTHGSTTTFMTLCEGKANNGTDTNTNDDNDPYENLPYHDEPTHCSICLTYRQGPCRPLWRKVEACTKDNEIPTKENDDRDADADEDDESSRPDPPCLKYMMPWIECASGYRNLYALIELDTNYTEGIEDLEQTANKHLCWMADETPSVDWMPWQEYVNVLNTQWTLPPPSDQHELQPQPKQINVKKPWIADLVATARSSTKAEPQKLKKTPLWKLLDQSSDPEVVSIEAKVPSIRETIGSDGGKFGVMECAYAVDQDGQVLGFAYGVRPSDAVAGKTPEDKTSSAASDDQDQGNSNSSKTTDTTTNDDESKSDDDGGTTVTMTIRLLPNRTRHIVIAASYTQISPSSTEEGTENGDASSSSSNYETHVYKSKPMKLDEMVAQRKE